MLQNFSIHPNKEEIKDFEKTKKFLSKALIPCWNDSSNFYALSLINPNLINLNAFSNEESNSIPDIMEYILLNCFGENISKLNPVLSFVNI